VIVPGQMVEVKWNNSSRKHYESKGYEFTYNGDIFLVKVEDLTKGSNSIVKLKCDHHDCDNEFARKYISYTRNGNKAYCSLKCANNHTKKILYTKEILIDKFWEFYKEFSRFPSSDDFRYTDNYPSDLRAIRKYFNSWNGYLKEIGVIDKDNSDGWYIHDEAIMRRYYPNNDIKTIVSKLMVKRSPLTIRDKASAMGLKVNTGIRYPLKYKNEKIKQEIKNEAIDYYKAHQIAPTILNLKCVENPRNAINQNWESYNDFLGDCNIPIPRRTFIFQKKEDGLIFLNNLKDLLGRVPYITDADKHGVPKSWFSFNFGSYKNALYEAGLVTIEEIDEEMKLNESIELFKKYYDKIGRVPKFHEFKKYASEYQLFHPKTMIQKINGVESYVDLCKLIVGNSNVIEYTIFELLMYLYELKNKLGRVPMAKELSSHGYPSYYIYKYAFNKRYFNDILRELGWEPLGQDSKYKSDDELLKDYMHLYKKISRVPLGKDIDNDDSMCSSATYITRFGGLSEVCSLLDLNYNELIAESHMGCGVSCFDLNGGICRSIPEMEITNILIKNNLKYQKEYPYNVVLAKNDKRRFDWEISDKNLYIEYFGLFNEKDLGKDSWSSIYSQKTIKKIKDCRKANITLIDLYPSDLQNNYEGLIKKFAEKGIEIKV